MWYPSGRVTNPTANQVMADTDVLSPGARSVTIVVAANAAAVLELQHRNNVNDTTLSSQIVAVPANGTIVVSLPDGGVYVEDQERLRLIMVSGTTGAVSASMFVA